MTGSLEIAVQDLAGVTAAAAGGADRVELGTALALGGLTPSLALIEGAVQQSLPVHVLVRPREGGFEFSSTERSVMLSDVRAALRCGAAGVVIGATRNGEIDHEFVAEVRELATDVDVTFHRAFDTLADRRRALEDLITLGVDRVLTSGGASSATQAVTELSTLVCVAQRRIELMAGGGITAANVAGVAASGVDAIHSSAKTFIEEALPVGLGTLAGPGRAQRTITDQRKVRALRAALDALSS